jgi:preprotein translocase subunit SecA
MFSNIVRFLGGDPHKREIQKLSEIVKDINDLETSYEALSDDALRAKTAEFRARLAEGETLDELLPEAFAAVREASKRTIGLRHFDVQMIGGINLHKGKIAEMRTGEGKTLVATLPVYLNALTGRGVHLITVNDYLARRDARWMAPVYQTLGLSVGVLQMAARSGGGASLGYLVDLTKSSPHEDQNQLRLVSRSEAYLADVTYGTNSEFGFDYLRDNLTLSLEERVQRGHYFAIIDEVDNILIDEARTPLIISGPAQDEAEWYVKTAQVVRQLNPEDYEINEKDRAVSLTEAGEAHIEILLGMALRDPERPEDITPEQARMLGYIEQALRAQHLYKRNKDYLVQAGKVIIIDEFTGRLMPGRRWSEGLHQAVEAKEGVKVEPENVTYATITLQNYFRMYDKLAGMTGTALTESEEFGKIYKLEVLAIPTNLEYAALLNNADLKSVEEKDEHGYKFTYYTRRDDPKSSPIYWKRKDYPDLVYRTAEAKLRAMTQEILCFHVIGRPQLVGTTSVEHSELLSARLQAEPIRRLAQVLLIRNAWLTKNKTDMIAANTPELEPLKKPIVDINVGELRPLARSLGIASMNPEDPENMQTLATILDLKDYDSNRLLKALQAGIPHQVLNARKHDEESMIIARAGAFGAVTIATNMAGRGVDIKLGGELPENILQDTNRVLGRTEQDPYDLTIEERRQALLKVSPEDYGIYEESVTTFLQYVDDMRRVRELGGLHVIGSERHEARRIDNQLRGRSARQGDPGSSRFYLSLEDDLMRLFGGQQVENLWKRIFSDDSQPLEMNILGRLVEQSQERVEGANFDVRKHLLEYDDVLNSQRQRIYGQRDMAFTKDDLSEDVLDMLRRELQTRVPQAFKDEEGPWKLLAYLDEVQPSFEYSGINFPSFTNRLLIDEVRKGIADAEASVSASAPASAAATPDSVRAALLALAQRALEAERDHLLRSVQSMLEKTEESLEHQREERYDALDTFVEALGNRTEEDEAESGGPLRPQDVIAQITELVRVPVKLNFEQSRALVDGDREVIGAVRQQVSDFLVGVSINRMIAGIERRLEESLNLRANAFQGKDWNDTATVLLDAVEAVFNQRAERLLGSDGQIAHDLEPLLARQANESELTDRRIVELLGATTHGSRMQFDARTHQRSRQQFVRLNYVFLTARLVQDSNPDQMTAQVLEHLEEAVERMEEARGLVEWDRLVQSQATLAQLEPRLAAHLREQLGLEHYEELTGLPVSEFNEQDRALMLAELGHYMQNEVYRDLLLRVISEQWVDYLTRMEALRVSIGLEAYAQRDPLVQYKSQSSELFKALLAEIRMGVISHVFTYVPRHGALARSAQQAALNNAAQPEEAPAGEDAPESEERPEPVRSADGPARSAAPASQVRPEATRPGDGSGKKKRKRH